MAAPDSTADPGIPEAAPVGIREAGFDIPGAVPAGIPEAAPVGIPEAGFDSPEAAPAGIPEVVPAGIPAGRLLVLSADPDIPAEVFR